MEHLLKQNRNIFDAQLAFDKKKLAQEKTMEEKRLEAQLAFDKEKLAQEKTMEEKRLTQTRELEEKKSNPDKRT